MESYEYRVIWRRRDWSRGTQTKSRTFARQGDADRHYGKLSAGNRPDLSPLSVLRYERRPVGAWELTVPQ